MNLYVGNLNFDVTEDELREAFGKFGQVTEVRLIMDRATGKSKGFGFVEMPSKEEAQEAIEELNGQDLNGRDMKVNEAKPKTDQPGGRGGRGGGFRGGPRGGGGGGRGGREGGPRGGSSRRPERGPSRDRY